ncbi:portal protein [Rhodobacteraceae phage LS06-2018-MD05]|nr:portal protein [Rhodobacteraceae phage LS06-2018-MD05]
MILSENDILEKYNNPDPRIADAKQEHKELLMQVHGCNLPNSIIKIEGLENDEKIALRKRLSISNKSMWSEVLRPMDKIFKANGGSRNYNLKKKQQEQFRNILSNITEGLSLRKWLENYWSDKVAVDPNGIFLIEHDGKDAYPTYKSILDIQDYSVDGQDIDYIIFKPIQKENYELLRVYDDEGDKLFKKSGDSLIVIEDQTFINPWGKVPGTVISDLINTLTGLKNSTIEKEKELAKEYLRENSVFTLFKYHHGFPFFWQYMSACPVCKGKRFVDGKECATCNGTGFQLKKDVSDVTYIKPPSDKEQPIVAPDLAGYVVPPLDSARWMAEELTRIKQEIVVSHWGTVLEVNGVERTATEVTINAQPIQDRLNKYSDSEEIVEEKLTDLLGEYYFENAYKGSSINNGRNYIIKGSEVLLNEYMTAREKGSNETTLNDMLIQYYETLYQNDAINLSIHIKLIQVEPLVHYSVMEVLNMNLPESIKQKKYLYTEWLSTINKDKLFSFTDKQLRDSLNKYVKSKSQENEMQSNSSLANDDNQRQEV